MTDSPDIEWLQRKWALPDDAAGSVRALLRSESEGGTACGLSQIPESWGAATGNDGPLVVVSHGGQAFLQSRRFYELESDIARQLRSLNVESVVAGRDMLDSLFPESAPGDPQREAAKVALSRRLSIITGGPGTGKTYTVARILAAFAAQGITGIQLAAPTGKAADRMKAAVLASLETLPPEFGACAESLRAIAQSSSTIHSLLGYHPGLGRVRFDIEPPFEFALLVVDECSMIDTPLWHALLSALPPTSRLLLLGDPNQLESVGQGNVFPEIARAAREPGSAFFPARVHLTEARRFQDRPAILELAHAFEQSDADAAEGTLRASLLDASRGVVWLEAGSASVSHFPRQILTALETVVAAATPTDALEALSKVCVLTAQRQYSVGAAAMSQSIEDFMTTHPGARNHPIIVNQNDPETGLRNGSVGIIHVDEQGHRQAWFPGPDGSLMQIALARLPDFNPAWVITIHRSQGSEYDDVLVIVPHEQSPLATRELLYTAITRARRNVFIIGNLSGIRKAVVTSGRRTTLLMHHLER